MGFLSIIKYRVKIKEFNENVKRIVLLISYLIKTEYIYDLLVVCFLCFMYFVRFYVCRFIEFYNSFLSRRLWLLFLRCRGGN